ncbi:ferrous iron transport protein B [Haliangium ochraceum]|uniref:Ferrous iron transport protein B n=1 Tax=Haliangium ochraceum (strain DSM 14365 / JCM 11303 / SMP-2) TaxID=502025 RepID=D0LL11_HALO1|nr:ferrous iron transport protein B [Haliangium ochraceum]ACY16731.1 ferrous iron transport protein B [Haliangium ochraceum DSM 14365]
MSKPGQRPIVAIAGNPNTGKTTLFNALTGRRARVGNYPGVTVERRSALIELEPGAGPVEVLDVPGAYSLLSRTAEEQIAFDALLGMHGLPRPEAVVFCVDATQLVRSSYVVLQAQEMGLRVVVALTMSDEAGPAAPEPERLAQVLGCEVVAVVARERRGLGELRAAMQRAVRAAGSGGSGAEMRWRFTPSDALAGRISRVREALPEGWLDCDAMALWALMSVDDDDELTLIPASLRSAVRDAVADVDAARAIDDEVIEARYRWLDTEVAPLMRAVPDRSLTERVDRILLNRVAGFGAFLAIMFVVFQSLFAWADPAITLIEEIFGALGEGVETLMPAGIVRDFVVEGLIAGVGSVLVFLPQILLLFLFLGIMEDSGYLARVAYLMDRIMKSMNLHGRAFVPMLSGFACAVPAILATRTMERRRDRLLTMMVVPLMTCSARLPVYTLVIAALYPAGEVFGFFPVQGLLMVAMYVFSTATALAAAWVLSRTVKPLRAKRLPFVIELPPYRLPRMRDVLSLMWERSRLFLTEAGGVILVCTIVLWGLLSFPQSLPADAPDYDAEIAQAVSAEQRTELENARDGALLRNSVGGRMGHAIEPVIAPLGFDWKIGVGIIGAFAAREVFISTMGVVYATGADVDEESTTLRDRMREEVHDDGAPVYTPLVGLSLMVFFALACQCMSTLAVVKRETGGYRWPLFLFAYMTGLAWLASFAVYQGGRLLGFG